MKVLILASWDIGDGHVMNGLMSDLVSKNQIDPEFSRSWQSSSPQDEIWAACQLPKLGESVTPEDCKRIALNVALRGTGFVSPNPLVGAVAVDFDHKFLGAAAHLKVGDLHAEANLLSEIQLSGNTHRLKGGTIYVTLEPCAHVGRTPSCADALAQLPLKRVVYGARDPNPKVNGLGATRLRGAGIDTVFDESWTSDCTELAESFLHAMEILPAALPAHPGEVVQLLSPIFVGLKVASTLDGVVAQKGDKRRWITGDRARMFGHYLRQRYDSILVGPATALLDNPTLDVRYEGVERTRIPLRIILDPKAEWSSAGSAIESNLVKNAPEKTLVIVPLGTRIPPILVAAGITFIQLPLMIGTSHFSWDAISGAIRSVGVQSLLIEGGPGIYSSALKSGLVRKIHWFCAPDHSGLSSVDSNALRWFHGAEDAMPSGFDNLKIPHRLEPRRRVQLGRDLLIEGYWQS